MRTQTTKKQGIKHEPTKPTRDTVSLHSMVGTPQDIIASILNIDAKTLRKHYREELDHALAKANATIGGSLFNKAKGGDTSAQIFWLKTRAGFREKEQDKESEPQPITINFVDAVKPDAD